MSTERLRQDQMLRVDYERWDQTPADLRQLALSASHARSRERLLALYNIAQGACATDVAECTGRRPQTVMDWLHIYNEHGPEALVYQRTGGRPPFCPEIEAALGEEICAARQTAAEPPIAGADPKPRWTLRRLVSLVHERFARRYCRETIRAALRRLDLSWKKARKLLGRANPERRKAFVGQIGALLDGARDEQHALVYLDEAHIHQDVDLGYGWRKRGQRFHVASSSPGLSAKVSFYGLYLYNEGQVRIWPYPRGNGANTIDVLRRLRTEIPKGKLTVIWDGAPYHRSATVWSAAASLDIHIEPLPGYSPDLMPVEPLWRWLREDVTYNHCHATAEDLIRRVAAFESTINQNVWVVADRLWVKDHLDPEEEKLRFSS
jgi:transposase